MNTWKVILATMLIFGTGVITGGLLVHHEHSRAGRPPRLPGVARPAPTPSAGGMRLEFLRRAQRDLDLSPEQRERIDKLLKDSQDLTRKLTEPVLQRTRQQFLEVLTPPQRARFEELMQQQQRLREQRHATPPRTERAPEAMPPTNAP